MKFHRLNFAYASLLGVTFLVLTAAFQNCSRVDHSGSSTQAQQSGNAGNGDAYSGKPDKFRHFDAQQSCAQKDLTGKALPNDEIFFQLQGTTGGKAPFMVRESCQDIAPRLLSASDVQFTAGVDDTFKYKDSVFTSQNPPGDFDLVASQCPAGTALKPLTPRTNLILSAQDWTKQVSPVQGWFMHQGIAVNLNGTIDSLPSYEIVRNDPQYLDEFRRVSQHLTLQQSTRYAYSFLGRAGSSDSARFRFYRDLSSDPAGEAVTVNFDFLTGVASIVLNANLPPAEVAMTPVANGFLCTVYITTSAAGDQSVTDVGVSAAGTTLGSSVLATDAQLERVQDFCQ